MQKKRILSIVFSLVMVAGLLPAAAFAEGTADAIGRTYTFDKDSTEWEEDPSICILATKSGQTLKYGDDFDGYKTYTDSSPIISGDITSEGVSKTEYSRLIIKAESGATANLTISDFTSINSVIIKGEGDVVIEIDGTNSITGNRSCAAISKQNSGWLILKDENDDGSLTATGGEGAAGIGSDVNRDVSNIRITGGTVTATGGKWVSALYGAAGIGSGYGGDASNIEIFGGKITATGYDDGAGIGAGSGGGGTGGNCENITISGGEITASTYGSDNSGDPGNSKSAAAGIGAGFCGNAKNITITGGTVIATAPAGGAGIAGNFTGMNSGGAGIGGGGMGIENYSCSNGGDASDITITGGTVTATGGYSASGIGGGAYGCGKDITITGGSVTAKGNDKAAGIGGGAGDYPGKKTAQGDGENITITGGTVNAVGGANGSGIGGGSDGSGIDITISGGNVTAEAGDYNHGAKGGAGIGSGMIYTSDSGATCSNINITGGEVRAVGNSGIGAGAFKTDEYYDAVVTEEYKAAVASAIKISGDAKVTVQTGFWVTSDASKVYGGCIGIGSGRTKSGVEVKPDTSKLTADGYIRYYESGADIEGEPTTTENGKYIPPTDISKCSVKLAASSYAYSGNVRKPAVTAAYNGTELTSADYTVAYSSGCKNVGKYKVTVKGKGNYTGTKTLYFTINPKATAVSKLTKGTKSFKSSWSKVSSQATGYQLQYALDSKFTKSKKTVTITSYKTTSKTISKLKAKKKYYVKVRTYKKVGDATYYSAWSKTKTVTTK